MAIMPPTGFDDETVAWGYAPPSHLEGEPAVPIPATKPGLEIAPNQPVRLDSGVVAYRETAGHRQQVMEYERQAAAARQAARQAAEDAAMFQQMSRVATSLKDITEARRSIDVMGFQRDVDELTRKGVPIQQALFQSAARHPMAFGESFGSTMKNLMPETAPTRGNVSGMGEYLVDSAGRPHWRPASSMPAEPLGTTAVPITDPSGNVLGYRAATGPRTGTIVQRAPTPGSITQEKRMVVDALKVQLRDVERAIADNTLYSSTPTVKAKIDEWTRQRDDLKRKLADLVPGGFSVEPAKSGATGIIHPLPSDKSKRVKGQLYETPKGAAEWTGDGWILRETK